MEIENDYENEYLLELEKLMNSEVSITKWAPTMDILALATFDNFIEGYRINFKAQRFFQIEESQPVSSMCFSPDSQILAYALIDGSVKLIKTENGEKLITLDHLGCEDIQNINFLGFSQLNPDSFMPLTKKSIENKLILNISPHKNCNKNAIIKINYFQELKQNFSCLLLSDMNKTFILLNGFMQIAEINYREVLGFTESQKFRVLFSHIDQQTLYSVVAEEIDCYYSLFLIKFSLAQDMASKNSKADIIGWSCLLSNISEILNFIESTYTALEAQIRDIVRQYNSKINLIDDGVATDVVPCKELLRYLTIGLTSSTLINFFQKQVYDSKILQKLDETLTTLFAQLHDIILESVQNGLQRITLIINKLLSWVSYYSKVHRQNKSYPTKFGIAADELLKAQQMVNKLYTLGEILMVESTQAKFNIRNLLVWLNKTTIKTSQENDAQIENSKSYLNKYTVDYGRLHKFLEKQEGFKLQNLLYFFRKTQDLSPMVITPADFGLISSSKINRPKNCQDEKKKISYDKLEKLLQIEDIQLKNPEKDGEEHTFYSFKVQMKKLLALWKQIVGKPVQNLSKSICTIKNIENIGKIILNEDFEFNLHPLSKDNILLLYYIEHPEDPNSGCDTIVEFNTITSQKSFLYSKKYKIISISVSPDGIIAVLQNKESQVKIIAQISNQKFDGTQIETGKLMSNCDQGVLDIECSKRGLNCLVVDKTKLVIFD